MLGTVVPSVAGGKLDKLVGTGKLGQVVKAGMTSRRT